MYRGHRGNGLPGPTRDRFGQAQFANDSVIAANRHGRSLFTAPFSEPPINDVEEIAVDIPFQNAVDESFCQVGIGHDVEIARSIEIVETWRLILMALLEHFSRNDYVRLRFFEGFMEQGRHEIDDVGRRLNPHVEGIGIQFDPSTGVAAKEEIFPRLDAHRKSARHSTGLHAIVLVQDKSANTGKQCAGPPRISLRSDRAMYDLVEAVEFRQRQEKFAHSGSRT